MYGENGTLMRAELSSLLRQHRIQVLIGAAGPHNVPVTTTMEQRGEIGEQIRRYRQNALLWCQRGTRAAAPGAASLLSPAVANPFRLPAARHGALAAMQHALDQAIGSSTSSLAGLDELTSVADLPIVEHWRLVARAAALGEHDFDAGLGHGRLDAQQTQTLIGDIAAVVRALVVLDQRYAGIPGWEKLHRPDRLGWSALACALDASLDQPDHSIDMRGWRPPTKVIKGPGKPGLLGVLQAEHNLVIRMQAFPSAMNLRLVIDSQRLLSNGLAELAGWVDPTLRDPWLARGHTYRDLQHELRDVGGRIGTGGLAVAEGANAISRLKALSPTTEHDPRVLHGFTTLFSRLDTRIADIIDTGIRRNAYFVRVKTPRIENADGELVAPPRERYLPLGEAEHTAIVKIACTRLRPPAEAPTPPPVAARSRADLHAAIVHQPERRATGPELSI